MVTWSITPQDGREDWLRAGDPVSVILGLRGYGTYNGCNGPTVGFFRAKILNVQRETSLVRFEKKIAPDYPTCTWDSFLRTNCELSDSDRGYVDEVMNNQLINVDGGF